MNITKALVTISNIFSMWRGVLEEPANNAPMLKAWNMIILLPLILLVSPLQAQVDYFAPENILRFADHLYQNGEYRLAVGEYQRYAYLVGTSDSLDYRIAVCWHLGGEIDVAMRQYRRIIQQYPASPLSDRARYQQAVILTQQGHHRAAIDFLAEQSQHMKSTETLWRAQWLSGLNHLYLRHWQRAEAELQGAAMLPLPLELLSQTKQLQIVAAEGRKIHYKSPTLAGVLSAVVPGSGKMYAGRWNDGFYSLILVGLFAYQSYDAFHDHGIESTKAWIYSGIGGVFYLGNIYGSILAVKIYNDRKEQQVLAKLEIPWRWE